MARGGRHELRQERQAAGRTLADVAEEAGVSTQYLSEIERGLKEPSSEILEAVSGALGLRLVELATRVARTLTRASPVRWLSRPSPLGRRSFRLSSTPSATP